MATDMFSLDDLLRPDPNPQLEHSPSTASADDSSFSIDFDQSFQSDGSGTGNGRDRSSTNGSVFDYTAFLVDGYQSQDQSQGRAQAQIPSFDFSSHLDSFLSSTAAPPSSSPSDLAWPTSTSLYPAPHQSQSHQPQQPFLEPFAFPSGPQQQPDSNLLSSFLSQPSFPQTAPPTNTNTNTNQRDVELLRQAQERIFAQLRSASTSGHERGGNGNGNGSEEGASPKSWSSTTASLSLDDSPTSLSTHQPHNRPRPHPHKPSKPLKSKPGSNARHPPQSQSQPQQQDLLTLLSSAGLPSSASTFRPLAPSSSTGGKVPTIAPKVEVRPAMGAGMGMKRSKSAGSSGSGSGSEAPVKVESTHSASGSEDEPNVGTTTLSRSSSSPNSSAKPKPVTQSDKKLKNNNDGKAETSVAKGKRLAAEKKALEDEKKRGGLVEMHEKHSGLANPGSGGGGGGAMGHNAVEKRYRENINAHISTLREIIPALSHLSDPSSSSSSEPFSLSSSSNPATQQPEGLVDGVLPANKISKGIVLSKAVEYILSLRLQRKHLRQDLRNLKREGRRAFELGKRERSGEREREMERLAVYGLAGLASSLDDEDGDSSASEDEEDDMDEDDVSQSQSQSQSPVVGEKRKLSSSEDGMLHPDSARTQQRRRPNAETVLSSSASSSGSGAGSPPHQHQHQHHHHGQTGSTIDPSLLFASSASSSGGSTSSHSPPPFAFTFGNNEGLGMGMQQPPRMLFAAFMGVSFVGGAGWEWFGKSAAAAGEAAGASASGAWALGSLVRRGEVVQVGGEGRLSPSPVETGMVALGVGCILCTALFVLWPAVVAVLDVVLGTGQRRKVTEERRNRALVALAGSKADEEHDDVHARLVEFVGAPRGWVGLVLGTVREGGEAAVREVWGGQGGEKVDEADAAAWVRMAEIECSPTMDFSRLRSFHTFLRLLNLSRSSRWPSHHHLTSQARVKGILAIHHVRNSHFTKQLAATLWRRGANAAKKADGDEVDEWTSLAVSTGFNEMSRIVVSRSAKAQMKTREEVRPKVTDTMPLLLVAESRYEVALVDTWAKIFVSVIRATCIRNANSAPLTVASVGEMTDLARAASLASGADSGTVVASIELINSAIEKILASTLPGTEIHALASMTAGVWFSAFGDADAARTFAQTLALDAKAGGPSAKLASARWFLTLIAGPTSPWLAHFEPTSLPQTSSTASEVDFLACATLQWLLVARRFSTVVAKDKGPTKDAALQESTLHLRRLLASPVFSSPSIVAASVGESAEVRQKRGLDPEMDMTDAVDLCVDALTQMGRKCAGIEDEDSGYETL